MPYMQGTSQWDFTVQCFVLPIELCSVLCTQKEATTFQTLEISTTSDKFYVCPTFLFQPNPTDLKTLRKLALVASESFELMMSLVLIFL